MELKSIIEIAEYLKSRGEKLKPLGMSEIKEIENWCGCLLPKVYKQFLALMGKGAGNYMRGSSVFYDEIFLLKEGTDELILENGITPLPSDAFVFWMHQGYQAAYFKVTDSDDPPVYYFSEGKKSKGFTLLENSLTKFFFVQLFASYSDLNT